jgi:N-acetylneuraminic acid mutarotase
MTATATYSDASTADVTSSATWSAGGSGDTGAAVVSTSGLATGTGVGSVTVKAAVGGVSGQTALTVTSVDQWSTLADMSTGRYGLGSAEAGGYLYVVGGDTCTNTCNTTVFERYDPGANSWSTLTALPHARRFGLVAQVGGKIYAIGGFNDGDPLLVYNDMYNPADDSWTPKAPVPAGVEPWGAVVNGLIYVITAGTPGTVNIYDPVGDSWTTGTGASLPSFPAVAAVGNVIYWMGGVNGSGAYVNTVYAYDTVNDSWSTKTAMTVGRGAAAAGTINGHIYLAGGIVSVAPFTVLNTIDVYDPAGDSWNSSPLATMTVGRQALGAAVLNGKFYALGGNDDAAIVPFKPTNEVYVP